MTDVLIDRGARFETTSRDGRCNLIDPPSGHYSDAAGFLPRAQIRTVGSLINYAIYNAYNLSQLWVLFAELTTDNH